VKVEVTVDTDGLAALKQVFTDIGMALTQIHEQSFKPTF
jgi:hypothetical protein